MALRFARNQVAVCAGKTAADCTDSYGTCPDSLVEMAFDMAASYCPVEQVNSRARVAQLLACMEINWSLPWGKPLS